MGPHCSLLKCQLSEREGVHKPVEMTTILFNATSSATLLLPSLPPPSSSSTLSVADSNSCKNYCFLPLFLLSFIYALLLYHVMSSIMSYIASVFGPFFPLNFRVCFPILRSTVLVLYAAMRVEFLSNRLYVRLCGI